MFWDKAFTQSPNIEALLEKEDLKVEDLLDDEDLLQECKANKRNLINYLTRPDTIKRLIELIIKEPSEDLPLAQRFKYANMACEVLTFGLPSLDEKLVRHPGILYTLYSFLEQEPPLNPLLSSFFSKTFSMLIARRAEQDWFLYQSMCLQLLEFIKTSGDFLDLIFKHFATPVIMDLLLQIIKDVQGESLKKDFYEWLKEQKLIERLIIMLGQSGESDKHDNIAEFLSELIKNGRSMRQKEENNDSFEPTFVGSDPLLQVIENEKTLSLLLDVILNCNSINNGDSDSNNIVGNSNGNGINGNDNIKESCIVAGINIVLTLVDKSILDEPASDKALKMIVDKEEENHDKIVSTVIRVLSPRLKEFHNILLNPPKKNGLVTSPVTQNSTPFGRTRLQICRLFTVLLKTENEDVAKEICETDFFNTLLSLFKQYNWNNFLHSEVEKCLQYVFTPFNEYYDNENGYNVNPSALQTFVIVNCKIVSKLIDSWMHNKDVQSSLCGHRLGYMGHLIQIFKHITNCISNSDHVGALIVSNLNEDELKIWKEIVDQQNGELKHELDLQDKFLANCNAHESSSVSLQKEFQNDNNYENYYSEIINEIEVMGESLMTAIDVQDCFSPMLSYNNGVSSNVDRNFRAWERSLYNDTQPLNINTSPWNTDPFDNNGTSSSSMKENNDDEDDEGGGDGDGGDGGGGGIDCNNSMKENNWADFENNFADFDAHFNSFSSDLGYSTTIDKDKQGETEQQKLNLSGDLENEFNNCITSSSNNCNNNNIKIFDDIKNNGDLDEYEDFEEPFENSRNFNIDLENEEDDSDSSDDEDDGVQQRIKINNSASLSIENSKGFINENKIEENIEIDNAEKQESIEKFNVAGGDENEIKQNHISENNDENEIIKKDVNHHETNYKDNTNIIAEILNPVNEDKSQKIEEVKNENDNDENHSLNSPNNTMCQSQGDQGILKMIDEVLSELSSGVNLNEDDGKDFTTLENNLIVNESNLPPSVSGSTSIINNEIIIENHHQKYCVEAMSSLSLESTLSSNSSSSSSSPSSPPLSATSLVTLDNENVTNNVTNDVIVETVVNIPPDNIIAQENGPV